MSNLVAKNEILPLRNKTKKKLTLVDEGLELAVSSLEVVIDNGLVVGTLLLGILELAMGSGNALLERVLSLSAAATETLLKLGDRRRLDRQVPGIEISGLDQLDTLYIQVEKNNSTSR